jgi:hypothetical protein
MYKKTRYVVTCSVGLDPDPKLSEKPDPEQVPLIPVPIFWIDRIFHHTLMAGDTNTASTFA